MKTIRLSIMAAATVLAGCASHYGTAVADHKPVEVVCPVVAETSAAPVVAKPPEINWALSVRYCDKPVVVWVQLARNGNLMRYDAEDPPAKEFKSTAQFLDWIDGSKHDVYDLPCVGVGAGAQKAIPIDPDSPDPGSHIAPPDSRIAPSESP